MTNPRHYNLVAYGDRVRTCTDMSKPGQHYEVVEELNREGQWVERHRFGHMSDDLAFTHARETAQALAIRTVGRH